MKFLLTLSLTILSACHTSNMTVSQDKPFYIDNVNIVDVANRKIIPNKQLFIAQGQIQAIYPAGHIAATTNTRIIDGAQGYITPGIIDMHVHIYDKAALTIALSHGVTHLRVMNGIPAHLEWRQQIEDRRLLGSSLTVSSPILSAFQNAPLHIEIKTPQDAVNAVKNAKNKGYDLIKAYGNLSKGSLRALILQAQKLDLPVAKHGPHPSEGMSWETLSQLQSLEHVEDIYQGLLHYQFDEQKLHKVIKRLAQLNVPITPTLNIFWQLTQISIHKQAFLSQQPHGYTSAVLAYFENKNQVKRWLNSSEATGSRNLSTLSFLKTITSELSKANVPLLIGSDSGVLLSPHGLATHNEMKLMYQAGIDAYSVLAAATINAAKALNKANVLGRIEPGFQADFIYTKHNPVVNLDVLSSPQAVTKNGVWHHKNALNRMRHNAIEERSSLRIIWDLIKAW